ncbi:MAG: acyltransferase family protein, partial [Verrucomicrobiota bacterium]
MIKREISERKFQIDALDGLRGIAALLVLAGHASNNQMYFLPFLDLRGSGKTGVFLFFLLSSFLLTIPLIDKGKKIVSVPIMLHYWQRRFFRIYPLYTLFLLCSFTTTFLFTVVAGLNISGVPFDLDF